MRTDSPAPDRSRRRSADPSPGLLSSRATLHAGCRILQLVLCVSLLVVARPAGAEEIVIRVGDASLTEGEPGAFDVTFEVTEETFDLAAYMIELNLSGPTSGVRFTGLAEPDDPVFPGRTPQHTSARPEFPGSVAAANDDLPSGSAVIGNGAGLIRVLFETDPDSAGVYEVTVDSSLLRTNFTNAEGDLLSDLTDVSFAPGQITVVDVVPEPSTIVYLLAAMLTLAAVGWSRRRTSAPPGRPA